MSQLKPTHISSFSYWAEENIRIVIAHYMCSAARYAYKLLSPGPHHRKTDNEHTPCYIKSWSLCTSTMLNIITVCDVFTIFCYQIVTYINQCTATAALQSLYCNHCTRSTFTALLLPMYSKLPPLLCRHFKVTYGMTCLHHLTIYCHLNACNYYSEIIYSIQNFTSLGMQIRARSFPIIV